MMKSIPVPSAEVQSLSQIHEAVARAHAVLSGDFGKEIETMKALREELIERQGTIDTVDKARALSIQADAHALEVKADAAKVRGDAKEANDKAVAKLHQLARAGVALAAVDEAVPRWCCTRHCVRGEDEKGWLRRLFHPNIADTEFMCLIARVQV